jgi:adenine/guanine phosphoribosyltransferase-like PRPP-binding protein
MCAESAVSRRPSNLIWVMPAKGVGLIAATARQFGAPFVVP